MLHTAVGGGDGGMIARVAYSAQLRRESWRGPWLQRVLGACFGLRDYGCLIGLLGPRVPVVGHGIDTAPIDFVRGAFHVGHGWRCCAHGAGGVPGNSSNTNGSKNFLCMIEPLMCRSLAS